MPSIVEELQALAYDSSVPIADLLRRVKVAATKLRLDGPLKWVDAELNGYDDDVPPYRMITGRLVYFNPVNGYQPIVSRNAELAEMLSGPRAIGQSVRVLEELTSTESDTLNLSLDHARAAWLQSKGVPGEPSTQISKSSLIGILDAVRTRILDWALELEQSGIHGSGVSFSSEEKSLAQHAPTINFYGDVGNIAGSVGVANAPVTVNARQISRSKKTDSVKTIVALLRDAAAAAPPADAPLYEQTADDLALAATEDPPNTGRLQQGLRMARVLGGRLLTWAGRTMLEAEIAHLIDPH